MKMPKIDEWHNQKILKKFGGISWNAAILELHKPENIGKYKSNFYERLAYEKF